MSDDLDSLLDSALDEYTTLSSNAAAQTSSNVNRSNANVNTNVTSATTDPSAAQVDAMAQEFLATMERVKELSNLLESDGSDDNAAPLTNAQSTHSSQQQQQQNQPSTEELAARLRAIAESTRESTDNLFNAASSAAAGGDANVPPGEADEAMLERVLQQLDSEPGMMQELVQQILSKDVLYEPMVELRDKYPQWLAANQLSLSSEDRARYARQHQLIGMICQEYESADVNYDRLTDLMGAVQQLGQPPREIVSQLAPDFPLDADGQPQVSPENCVVQ